jgi:hypothetical protein
LGAGLIFPFSQARGVASAGHKAWRRAQLAALKEALEGSREISPPALQVRQLLRIFCELAQKNSDGTKSLRGGKILRV